MFLYLFGNPPAMLLKNCRFVVTQDSERRILENTDVLLEGNKIRAIGQNLSGTDILDCSDRIVMPGLVNAHAHMAMTHLRGLSDDKELNEWLKDVWEYEKKFIDEDISKGAYLGIAESLRFGTTSVMDMFYRAAVSGEAAQNLGIRYIGAQSYAKDNPLSGEIHLPRAISGRVGFCLGPHSIYQATEEDLRTVRRIAAQNNALVTIHLAETRKERAEFVRENGMLPVEYLDRIGFLGDDVLLVHCVWLTKRELDIIARRGCKVIHCPQSNMKLASGGVMPLQEMRSRGIAVALGTDSAVSNNSLDMFREMHTAALLHKQHYWDATAADAQHVLDMATLHGALALGIDVGSIVEGKLADIITLDCNDVNLLPLQRDRVVSHLVYAANGMNVAEVMVDGKLLVEGKVFVDDS